MYVGIGRNVIMLGKIGELSGSCFDCCWCGGIILLCQWSVYCVVGRKKNYFVCYVYWG